MNDTSERLYTERPIIIWFFSIFWLAIGAAIAFDQTDNIPLMAGIIVVPLILVLLSPIVEVHGDRERRVLSIRRRYVWGVKVEEIPFDEIATVRVGEHTDSDGDITYRVEFILKNGRMVPLRKAYTSGHKKKIRLAQEVEDFLAMESETAGEQQAQPALQERDGVRWQVDYPCTTSRSYMVWFSPDARWHDAFLFLAQYPPAQRSIFERQWMKAPARMLLKQAMRMYDLDREDAPDLEQAQPLTLPASLSAHFLGLSDAPQRAALLLTPWVVNALSQWGQRHPMPQSGEAQQLTLHLGPRGLSLRLSGGVSGALEEEVISLGIELVKALPRQVAQGDSHF